MSIIEYLRLLVEWFNTFNSATYWLFGWILLFAYISAKWACEDYKYSRFPWHILLREFFKFLIGFLIFYYIFICFLLFMVDPEEHCLVDDPYNDDNKLWCITINMPPRYYFGLYDIDNEIKKTFKLECPVRWIEELEWDMPVYRWDSSPWRKNYYLPGDTWYPNMEYDKETFIEVKFFCSEQEAINSWYQRKKF